VNPRLGGEVLCRYIISENSASGKHLISIVRLIAALKGLHGDEQIKDSGLNRGRERTVLNELGTYCVLLLSASFGDYITQQKKSILCSVSDLR
jgi:hypothetical protein